MNTYEPRVVESRKNVELTDLREQIDSIDRQIVSLYEQRMQVCQDVARYKIDTGKKVLDRTRERQKIDSVVGMVPNDYDKKGVQELFEQIMATSRKLQYKILTEKGQAESLSFIPVTNIPVEHKKVVFQGAEGAYSQAAMIQYFGEQVDSYHVETFRDAMQEIADERADFAVLPIENSTAGCISEVYDLLLEYDNCIVGEQIIKIEHCLMGIEETDKGRIKTVYSHPQSLMQSAHFLSQYNDWQQISMKNNAFAAQFVSDSQDMTKAAIASSYAAKIYGLSVLEQGVNDCRNNATRFIIVTKDKIYKKDAGKVSICFEVEHRSGSLYQMLSHFIFNGLNLCKIESRPITDRDWEYRFFVDFEGNLEDEAVRNALFGIQEEASMLKVLGNY